LTEKHLSTPNGKKGPEIKLEVRRQELEARELVPQRRDRGNKQESTGTMLSSEQKVAGRGKISNIVTKKPRKSHTI